MLVLPVLNSLNLMSETKQGLLLSITSPLFSVIQNNLQVHQFLVIDDTCP